MSPFDVSGSATAPPTRALWLLAKADNAYYTTTSQPAPIDIGVDGDWVVRKVGLGRANDEDAGDAFDLVLVAAPAGRGLIHEAVKRRQELLNRGERARSPRFETFPSDVEELDRETVILLPKALAPVATPAS